MRRYDSNLENAVVVINSPCRLSPRTVGTIRGLHAFVFIPTRRLPVPNTLQIPLERNRDVQRRWQQMLQRTAAPRSIPPVGLKYSRTPVRFDRPINASSIKPKR